MLSVAAPLLGYLGKKSKRFGVQLLSSAGTGSQITITKSPRKKKTVVSLHKHDPIVNRHVIYFEQRHQNHRNFRPRMGEQHWIRISGEKIHSLLKPYAKADVKGKLE